MSTRKEFIEFVLEQLPEGSRTRAMMGEYVVYYRDKVIGDVCDDRLFVKPVPAALALLPDAPQEPPYDGAKPMLVVEDLDDREALAALCEAIWPELPAPKPKRKKPQTP